MAVTDKATFAATAQVLEDTGVRAYSGQAANVLQGPVLTAAATILGVRRRVLARRRRAPAGRRHRRTDRRPAHGMAAVGRPARVSAVGWRPLSSWYSSTPSEYTSVAVVTASARSCSGDA